MYYYLTTPNTGWPVCSSWTILPTAMCTTSLPSSVSWSNLGVSSLRSGWFEDWEPEGLGLLNISPQVRVVSSWREFSIQELFFVLQGLVGSPLHGTSFTPRPRSTRSGNSCSLDQGSSLSSETLSLFQFTIYMKRW